MVVEDVVVEAVTRAVCSPPANPVRHTAALMRSCASVTFVAVRETPVASRMLCYAHTTTGGSN